MNPRLRAQLHTLAGLFTLATAVLAVTPTIRAANVGTAITSVTAAYDNVTGTGGDYSATRYVDSGLGAASDPYNAPEPNPYTYQHQLDGGNLLLSSFNIGATNYLPAETPDRLVLRRVNNALVTGADVQLVWYERGSGSPNSATAGNRTIKPTAITGVMDNLPLGNVINKGIDNLFANNAGTSSNNVERVDVIFTPGLTPIAANLTTHGFLILDRGSNDRFKIAAITSLDGSNNPNSYGVLQSVPDTVWGPAGFNVLATVFRKEAAMTELRSVKNVSGSGSGEALGGVFITMGDLGITAGQTFYGYSLFANDVTGTAGQVLIDPSTFPLSTNDFSGGLDWSSGTTNVFSPGGAPTAVALQQVGQATAAPSISPILLILFGLSLATFVATRRAKQTL